jgi:hypothetical protein
MLQLLEATFKLFNLSGFEGGAHGPDIRVNGLDSDGRDTRLQLALEESLADIGVLHPKRCKL